MSIQRYTRARPCPICGGWESAPRGQGVRCHGYLTDSGITALCARVESDRGESAGLWIHRLPQAIAAAGRADPAEPTRHPRAADADLDRAYRRLLAALGDGPSERHLEDLRRRGWVDWDWSRWLYRSWPGGRIDRLREIAAAVAADCPGLDLGTVPGFRRHPVGGTWVALGRPGLLIPVRDGEGRVVGIVRRPDDPGDGGKYLALTSVPSGPRAYAAVHHATIVVGDDQVIVTEGVLKADLVSQLWGHRVIGLQGVGGWRRGVEAIRRLRARSVVLALDADVESNPDVARAEAGLVEALRTGKVFTLLARWDGSQAKGLDDALAAGVPVDLVEPPGDEPPPPGVLALPAPAPQRPLLEITPNEHEVILRAITVVGRLESVYHRAGRLVEIGRDHAIRQPSAGRVRELLTEAAEVGRHQVVETAPGVRERRWAACHPPAWLPNGIADRGDYGDAVRPIEGVLDAPTIRPDGSLLTVPGYDPATRLYLAPGIDLAAIPDDPTSEAKDAAERLLDLVGDFPWVSPEHAGVWLAGLLALVGRPAIDGPLPLWLISGNTPGTGKDLLVEVLSAIALGRPAPVTPVPPEEEFGKLLTAVLISGQRLVLLGNAANGGEVGFPALDAALTSTELQARVLGASELIRARHSTLWVATGNNVTPRHDLFRRCLPIRLESPLERPETRTDFRLADCPCCRGQVARHALTHRAAYLRDCLILLRHCHADAVDGGPTIGYPAFERAVLSPLGRLLGLDLTATRTISDADSEQVRIARAVILGWRGLPNGKVGLSARQALSIVEADAVRFASLRDALLEWSTDDRLPSPRTVGNRLKSFRGRVFGGWRIVQTTKGEHGVAWRVEPATVRLDPDSDSQSQPESGQSQDRVSQSQEHNFRLGNGLSATADSADSNSPLPSYVRAHAYAGDRPHAYAHAGDRDHAREDLPTSAKIGAQSQPDDVSPCPVDENRADSAKKPESARVSRVSRPTHDEDGWPLDEDGWPLPA